MIDISERIFDMKTDIFPLDRMISLETVYSTFLEYIIKEKDSSIFFRHRKYQRLREGYFSLFVAISLDRSTGKKHYLLFPSEPDNDVNFMFWTGTCNAQAERFSGYAFDVKEFTDFSKSFKDFISQKIIPKISIYNLIIGTYKNIYGNDIKILIDHLQKKDTEAKIWLVGSPTENKNYTIGKVTILSKDGIVSDEEIDLNKEIDKNSKGIIYHDIIRFKKQ